MKNLFKIGEIAELFNLNIKTLRYYDEIGLVRPETVDSKTGYRYYSTAQFEKLNTVRYLRELDVSLSEIKRFLENREVSGVRILLEDQIRQVEAKQRELETVKRKLQSRISQIADAEEGICDLAGIREFPQRKALLLSYSMKADTDLEYPIRLLGKNVPTACVFLGKVGLAIDRANLERGHYDRYDSIFLLLDEEEASGEAEPSLIEAGEYALIRFRGTHRDAEENYMKLMEFIRKSGYEIKGSSLEITLIDYGFTSDEKQFVTEIQIPVTKAEK